MEKKKFEKMFEMMKGCCTDEESMANCCAMMRKMMGHGKRKETEKKEKDSGKTDEVKEGT